MRAFRLPFYLLVFLFCLVFHNANGQKKEPSKLYDESTVAGLSFRLLGPSLTSGRIIDMAIDAQNNDVWYIAAASGGVWKTSNHGISFEPIFDGYGSYSIGCVEIAASNNNTIWVGTGENNNQRSVAYGDGVYKSTDGGKSFLRLTVRFGMQVVKEVFIKVPMVAKPGNAPFLFQMKRVLQKFVLTQVIQIFCMHLRIKEEGMSGHI